METALRTRLPNGRFDEVPPARSRAMGAVRGKGNKTTELRLRLGLVRAGVAGWKMHAEDVPGQPDFLFPSSRLAIFVDGCFWHGCPKCGHVPTVNRPFWSAKIQRNRARDARVVRSLRSRGYRVLRLWEHQLSDNLSDCISRVVSRICGSSESRATKSLRRP